MDTNDQIPAVLTEANKGNEGELPSLPSLSSVNKPNLPDATAFAAKGAGSVDIEPGPVPDTHPVHPAPILGAEIFSKVDDAPKTPADLTLLDIAERGCASARSALFAIPDRDTVEFCQLPAEVRQDVGRLLSAFERIDIAENKISACKVQAITFQGRRGFSSSSLYRKYYVYCEGWNWREIMDKAKAGPDYWEVLDAVGLPFEFLEYWRQLCQENQRKCRPAYRKLIRQWQAWHAGDRKSAIAGYDQCPGPEPGTGRPKGWEYSNLMRHKPTKFELKAARQGRSAAAEHRPLVLTRREYLRVGQYYLFDDLWHDFKVHVLGQQHAQRLLQFHALDLFSACNFARGYKPVLENEMTGAQERLKEAEMVFLVTHVLETFGYLESGTVLVVEHGTAAIRADLEAKIADLTGGKVKVERGGMEGAAAYAGMYAGRSKGNYRFKAALESLGNLIHNETADIRQIPGQTGSNSRLNCPEELHGREREHDALVRAMAALPPERAALLRLPFLEFGEAVWICNAIHDRINDRTEHELEGWLEAGLTAKEWRMAPDQLWLPAARLLALPAEQRQVIESYITSQPALTNVRKLSPAEVFAQGRGQLTRLAAPKAALLLYECGAGMGVLDPHEATVSDRLIEFEDKALGPGSHRYLADVRLPGRPVQPLPEGEKFLALVNPLDVSQTHLFDSKGGYIGACQRWGGVSRADTEALHRQMGQAAKIERQMLDPVARRGADITRQRIADARHNAAVLGGRPVTPEEQARARALRKVDASAAELLDPQTETTGPASEPAEAPDRFSAEALL